MDLHRFSASTVRAYDNEQLTREFERLLDYLPYAKTDGERQAACIEDLRTLWQEQSRRMNLQTA